MRAALVDSDGVVDNVIVLPDGDPDPVPVFIDGVQQFEDVETGELDDGNPVTEPRPVMAPGQPYAPPEGIELAPLPDDSPVGPGWRRNQDGGWVAPDPDPVTEEPVVDRLAALLAAAGVTPEQVIAALGGGTE